VLLLIFALSFLVGRFEAPREVGPTPPGWVVVVAAALTIVPPALIIEYFLNLPLAIISAVCFGIAILLLGRWPAARLDASPVSPRSSTA
jgi:hypothetical protein